MKVSILFLLIFINIAYPQNFDDIKILISNENELIFEYSPIYIDSSYYDFDEDGSILPLFVGASNQDFNNVGYADYRYRTIFLGLKSKSGNKIEILNTKYKDLTNKRLKKVKIKGEIREEYKHLHFPKFKDNFELVRMNNTGIVGDRLVGYLEIYPYQEIEQENKVRIFNKITVRVVYGSSSEIINKLYSDSNLDLGALNENISRNWKLDSRSLKKNPMTSVLSKGKWYRIKVTEEGIYKLDFNFLKSRGIDLSGVDPRTIKIYGNGGYALNEMVNNNNIKDLIENSIQVVGEEDGKFDQNDYILFYGVGTKGSYFYKGTNTLRHYFHYYTDNNYYFLTFGEGYGKRMQKYQSPNSTGAEVVNTVDGFVFHHEPKKNIAKTGRIAYGDDFNDKTKSRVYINKLPGLKGDSLIRYRINVVGRSPVPSTFLIEDNGVQFGSMTIPAVDMNEIIYYIAYERDAQFTRSSNLPDSRSLLKLTYQSSSLVAEGYLNFFEITYPRFLMADGDKFVFYSPNKTGLFDYKIGNFSNSDIRGYIVTGLTDIQYISPISISGSEFRFQVYEKKDSVSKYYLVGNNGYLQPTEIVSVPNQNLLGITTGAKFIIISPKVFISEAERLKQYKISRKENPLSTIVVPLEEIYNEFSGGLTDVSAIRDFIQYAYNNWQIRPDYVLLFGDGNYDYRNLEGYGNNYIPPYETLESLYLMQSFPTDDFFVRVKGEDLEVDLAIGRLNVTSIQEAKIAVDKIINYETKSDFGEWRNRITFVADDGLQAIGQDDKWLHTNQSEILANDIVPEAFEKKKLYLIFYPTIESSLGRRKPAVNKAIIDAVNEGTLMLNYIGHGNPNVWAHEYVFEKATSIPQLVNTNRLFFLTAATCDFGDYDNPASQSSTELMVLKANGGCIGGISSARIVWSHLNAAYNEEFYRQLFSWRKNNLPPVSVGWANFKTKVSKYDENDQKYHLFGDPTVFLITPRYNSSIDTINGAATTSMVNLKVLTKNGLAGSVRDTSGKVLENFNGEASIIIYDSKKVKKVAEWNYDVLMPGGMVFNGRSRISNGRFNVNFVIPKDVSYSSLPGKISIYYKSSEIDGSGYTTNVKIVAADSGIVNDKEGPKIDIYLDNDQSKYAQLVNQTPLLIVKLEDDNGINTTGTGVGHNIEAILNNDIYSPIDLNNYFQGELDKGNLKGEVRYKFNKLDVGHYNLKITAFDVFNNSASSEIDFEVVADGTIEIKNVYNYPNPFKDNTSFTFQHSYNQPVDIKIKIYTIAGRLIQTIEQKNVLEKFVKIPWDGRDNEGDVLGNGLYFYKIVLTTTDGRYQQEAIGKMSVIK